MNGRDVTSTEYINAASRHVQGQRRATGIKGVLGLYKKMGEGDDQKYLSSTHMTIFGGRLCSYSEHLFRMLYISTNEEHPCYYLSWTKGCHKGYTFPNRDTRCTDSTHDHGI
jgi:hypothetical protein